MRTFAIVALFLAFAASAAGQITVTGTSPANNATGVSLNTTISITFSAALDTTVSFSNGENILTNIPNPTWMHWSTDARTLYANVTLQSNTVYFLLLMNVNPATGGSVALPYVFYFTTAASFPPGLYTVSGTITPGTTGINTANAMIVLLSSPFQGNPEGMFIGAIADGSGDFVLPYVPAGKWYPLAAKDANGNGYIDPSEGDGIGYGDSVTVTNANVTGLTVTLRKFSPVKWLDVRDPVLTFAGANLPVDRQLRGVFAWDMDSLARSNDWEFVYTVPGNPDPMGVRADPFGVTLDTKQNWGWIGSPDPITDLLSAALPDSVIARAERMGGAAYRAQPSPDPNATFVLYFRGGDLYHTEFSWLISDTTKNYWGASYQWVINVTSDSSYSLQQKLFLADWTTGEILGVTGLNEERTREVPTQFSLAQNYPNPFNPSTSISFGLPVRSRVRLEIYNLIGQRVATLVNEERNAGSYEVTWTPSVPSGVYLYRIEAVGSDSPSQKFLQVRKMVLVK
jgi:methionine-rich copper-binding protein CopC